MASNETAVVEPAGQEQKPSGEQVIDPYNVQGGRDASGNLKAIDYDTLIEKFGVQELTDEHLRRFEEVTGKPAHRLMRRKLFFTHRDFDKILDAYEKHGTFMLYTGRGPSSGSMHLGHTIPFLFTKELQDMFDVPLVIMLTDDEKYLYTRQKKGGHQAAGAAPENFVEFALENIKDIMALGFDKKKTFIFSDFLYEGGHFALNRTEFESMVPCSQAFSAFGFKESTNIGLIAYGAKQCVAAFPSSYPELFGYPNSRAPDINLSALRRHKPLASIPTLIPCAIDQEPYFRMLRDRCERMTDPHPKTALILSKFLTALQGPGGKMSASDPNSAIFMSDTPNEIKTKINRYAFSGGRESLGEHRKHGGNPDVDVAYTYLSYFLEDDAELAKLAEDYRSGQLLTGQMKQYCIEVLQTFVKAFQDRRAKISTDDMLEYMKPRKLHFGGNPHPTHPERVPAGAEAAASSASAQANGAPTASAGKEGRGTKGERKAAKLAEKKEAKLAMRQKLPDGSGATTAPQPPPPTGAEPV